jgi:hypothetical protein
MLPQMLCHGVKLTSDKRVYKSEIRRNASQIVLMLLVQHSVFTVVSQFDTLNVSFSFFDMFAEQLQQYRQYT